MSVVERRTTADPEAVWAVIADGWTFASWVVGASRVRAVEPGWPAVGTRIHHSVGTWPAVLDDDTESVEVDPGHRLVLLARTRPIGEARVEIVVEGDPGGGTLIRMIEDFVNGPALLAPRPARSVALTARNTETLQRLALMAERRDRP